MISQYKNKNKIAVETRYKHAVIAVDVVIFTIDRGELKVLLIGMKKAPFVGEWAAPGGLVKGDEGIDAAAIRHLFEKTGVENIYLEQIATFGEPERDPFGRVVSVAYFALVPSDKHIIKTTEEYSDVKWFSTKKLPKLAYDHKEIIETAVRRLQSKLEYTNIVFSLMPREFTLTELQEVYEIILGRRLDKRNFRKKILSGNLLSGAGKMRRGEKSRPAELWRFRVRKPRFSEIL